LQKYPFASLLFEPIDSDEVLIKKNIPAIIIGYNQVTYIRNMVKQLERYTSDIVIIDNNSSFKPLLDYYEKEFNYTLLKQKANYGHVVYNKKSVQKLVGAVHIMTDPDLKFNSHLPNNFLQTLIEISYYYKAQRVGFALQIDAPDIRNDLFHGPHTIQAWERQFWRNRLQYPDPNLELYDAPIDTTFCLVNKKFEPNGTCIRVAGDFTCKHLPWHTNFRQDFLNGEYETYLKDNITSTWFRIKKNLKLTKNKC